MTHICSNQTQWLLFFFMVILSFRKNDRIMCMRARLCCVQYCLYNCFELCIFCLFVYYGTGYFEFVKLLIIWFHLILFILEKHPCQFPFQFLCVSGIWSKITVWTRNRRLPESRRRPFKWSNRGISSHTIHAIPFSATKYHHVVHGPGSIT